MFCIYVCYGDVVEVRRGQTHLGTFFFSVTGQTHLGTSQKIFQQFRNKYDIETSQIVLEANILLQILMVAYKSSPNLFFPSLIKYLTLGRVSHLQTLYHQLLQRIRAQTLFNLPLHHWFVKGTNIRAAYTADQRHQCIQKISY